jgi:hypothetical protein
MPRLCTVCTHPQRPAIERGLVAESGSYRDIARQWRLSKDALARHKAEHLPTRLVQAQEAENVAQALDVVQQLKAINAATLAVLKEARERHDGDLALKAVDRVQRQIELQAKLLGELDERPQVNLLVSPEWVTVRAVLLAALGPYPEARAAVAARLVALDGGNGASH